MYIPTCHENIAAMPQQLIVNYCKGDTWLNIHSGVTLREFCMKMAKLVYGKNAIKSRVYLTHIKDSKLGEKM